MLIFRPCMPSFGTERKSTLSAEVPLHPGKGIPCSFDRTRPSPPVFGENHPRPEGLRSFLRKPCTVGTRHFAAHVLRDFGLRAGILNLLNSSYYGKHIHHRDLAAMRCSVQQQIRTDTALPGFETVIRNICSAATTIRPSLLFYISINIHSIYLKSN